MACLRSLDCGYGLTCAFVPGNRHALIGTKAGTLLLFDLASGNLVESHEAHAKELWTIAMQPDKRGFVTGSADHSVKFWEFELEQDGDRGKRLTCVHTRTLKMSDDVLSIMFSPDQRLLAISLLDSSVKVFYADSLKFFLSLYGHKLPVVSLDISADSTLLISGSADKNVKVWGLDFGDCHKSFFAHQDTVTSVKFVSNTHYFFSTSKDRSVKYWDADRFEHIATLQGHQGEVWCSAVNQKGSFLVTGSHDRSLRVWDRTAEILNPEEEREVEREAANDLEEAQTEARRARALGKDEEAGPASKRTAETLKAAERLMEALDLAEADAVRARDDPKNPILVAMGDITGSDYVLQTLDKIRSSELEEALLVLPFTHATQLLGHINKWVQVGRSMERVCRCLFYLARIHYNQITATQVMLPVLEELRRNTRAQLQSMKDLVGVNMAGMSYLQRELEARGIRVFEDVQERLNNVKTKKRKATSS
eukprot:m.152757 g.152757  ORF g.152757 m.152757 type:complete len:480 (+) comp16922_c0_seq3:1287-2726(+)